MAIDFFQGSMLSRVADALFWMSRYLERAEHVSRLLDVCFHLELDLHGVLAGPHKLHWQLCDPDFTSLASESPHEFYLAVECGSHVFQGVCDATVTHDEGWQFIQLGKYLERADKTLRILDIQYHLLHDMLNPKDKPLANLQWAAVL